MLEPSRNLREPSRSALRWVAGAVGSGAKIQSVYPLAGATSSVLHGVEVLRNGRSIGLVLRRFVNEDWLELEPDLALHEAACLKAAAKAQVPTPELIAFDEKGEHCGFPATLMTRLTGSVELQPENFDRWLHQLAEAIIPVHSMEPPALRWTFYTYYDISKLAAPVWSKFPELWEKAIEIVAGQRPQARECFIHRDYHPTNVLWHEGRISGVVDWVNACLGAAGIDVSWCRLNLAKLYGVEPADRFLHAYQDLAGASFTYHPFWDLLAAMELLPGPPDVYEGWAAFGIRNLNEEIVRERADEYLFSIMARL
ncbi:MAG: aminoglycoside phosphotransferase family protein [Pyrinomonadaceae bacterium]